MYYATTLISTKFSSESPTSPLQNHMQLIQHAFYYSTHHLHHPFNITVVAILTSTYIQFPSGPPLQKLTMTPLETVFPDSYTHFCDVKIV